MLRPARSALRVLALLLLVPLAAPGSALAAGWLAPTDVSSRVMDTDYLTLDVGDDGTAVSVWVQEVRFSSASPRYVAMYRHTAPDGTRHDPRFLSGTPGPGSGGESYPAVSVAKDGSAVVAWSSGSAIKARRIAPDGDTTGPVATFAPANVTPDEPAVATASDGSALIAWEGNDSAVSRSELWVARLGADGSAGTPKKVFEAAADTASQSSFWENRVRLAVAPGGTGVVTDSLLTFDVSGPMTTRRIVAVRVAADGSPAGARHTVLGPVLGNGFVDPQVGIADDGTALLSFDDGGNGGPRTLSARRLAPDDTLGPVIEAGTGASTSAALAVAPDGEAILAWEDAGDIRMSRVSAAGSVAPKNALVADSDAAEYPRAAIGRGGQGLIAWDRHDAGSGEYEVHARPVAPGGALGTGTQVGPDFPGFYDSALAIGGADAALEWIQSDPASGKRFVRGATYDATAPATSTFAVPSAATAGEPVVMAGGGRDRSGVTYAWDFGDGGSAASAVAQHTYAAAGSYDVALTLTDGAGNARVERGSVVVASAGGGGTPAPPAAGEDAAPAVTITAPAAGTRVRGGASTTASATASDDKGVAAVVFSIGGREVCRDEAAPYTCAIRTTGADVGRTALIARAVDGAGQTATATRALTVTRFAPRSLTARAALKAGTARTAGRLRLPAGVAKADGCDGRVRVTLTSGAWTRTVTAKLRRDCSYRTGKVTPRGTTRRLAVRAAFAGNEVLGERASRRVTARR